MSQRIDLVPSIHLLPSSCAMKDKTTDMFKAELMIMNIRGTKVSHHAISGTPLAEWVTKINDLKGGSCLHKLENMPGF